MDFRYYKRFIKSIFYLEFYLILKLITFIETCKISKLVMYLNSCSIYLGRETRRLGFWSIILCLHFLEGWMKFKEHCTAEILFRTFLFLFFSFFFHGSLGSLVLAQGELGSWALNHQLAH